MARAAICESGAKQWAGSYEIVNGNRYHRMGEITRPLQIDSVLYPARHLDCPARAWEDQHGPR